MSTIRIKNAIFIYKSLDVNTLLQRMNESLQIGMALNSGAVEEGLTNVYTVDNDKRACIKGLDLSDYVSKFQNLRIVTKQNVKMVAGVGPTDSVAKFYADGDVEGTFAWIEGNSITMPLNDSRKYLFLNLADRDGLTIPSDVTLSEFIESIELN